MNSEIRFRGPNTKITIIVGVTLAATIIILAAMFRFEFGLILLAVAGSIALIGIGGFIVIAGKAVYRFQVWKLDIATRQQDLRLATYKADRARLEANVLNFPKTQRLVTLPDNQVRVIEAIAEPAMLPASTEAIDLLTALEGEQRVLIKGVSNAGKTNLLQWIASRKVSYSKVLVIDPHASPDKWLGCQVVGLGSNHNEIAIALDKLIDLMIERYQDIATGKIREGGHKQLTIIVDEWMSIAYECDNAKSVMVRLLTESRKAAFSVYVGSHSDRVASLGLDGKGDLRDGFCLVRLSIVNNVRSATLDYGNGEQPAILPDRYQATGQILDSVDYLDLEVQPTPDEAFVLKLYGQGESYRSISQAVYGQHGQFYNEKIQSIIDKFGEK